MLYLILFGTTLHNYCCIKLNTLRSSNIGPFCWTFTKKVSRFQRNTRHKNKGVAAGTKQLLNSYSCRV